MNKQLHVQIQWLLIVLMTLSFYCTPGRIADGGTEDVNTRVVIGKVLNEDSSPASNAQVLLIPSNYDPVHRITGGKIECDIDRISRLGYKRF